ncbi:MAG: rod shape-determining protein MreC [Peptoniphilus sp.]|nr:rod shape-determining protein MreC [Peptoniphilus sp.]MDD7363679.1 rod shape-determining protein MreC [Bacillota bacterium]MDY6044064.1 rod shape-determining protein MreC [Peptoniphilus sp.]
MDKIKKSWIYRGIAIVALLFFGFTSPGAVLLGAVESGLQVAISPLVNTLNVGMGHVSETADGIVHFATLRRDNDEMKKKITELEEENRNLQDIVNRSTFLSNADAIRKNHADKPVEARVTAKSSGLYFNRFSIDKGSKAGISAGDTVVSAMRKGSDASIEGIVGYVTEVTPYQAKVRSIIDEDCAVSFRSTRTSDGGVLRGVNRELEGYAFDMYSDLVVGDSLFTTGIGDSFAPDLYIGTVSEVSTDEDKMMKNVKVKSAIDFHKIYHVFVLTGAR